jgi:FtsH-binding integral membrane protein
MLCYVVATFKTEIVIYAVGITLAIFFALTAFAFQTKIDFTVCHQLAFVMLWVLILFGFIAGITRGNNVVNLVYSALGAVFFCFFLVIDTQLIIGGGRFAISPEDYILAAVVIYMDVINLFLYILRLLNGGRSS